MPLQPGVGATCSFFVKFLYPTELVRSVITNVTQKKKKKRIRPHYCQKGGGGGESEEATCSCASL